MIDKDKFIKLTLCLINLVITLIGFCLISISLILRIYYKNDYYLTSYLIQPFSLIFIILGALAVLFGIFGFIGILRKNFIFITLFILYSIILITILFTSALCLFLIKSNDGFISKISNNIKRDIYSFKESQNSITPIISNENNYDDQSSFHINQLHLNYKCCGLYSYRDWNSSINLNDFKPYFVQDFFIKPNQIPFNVPDTCCTNSKILNCGKSFVIKDTIYKTGCYFKLKSEISDIGNFIFAIANVITSIIILSIAFIIFTAGCIENEYSFKEIFDKEFLKDIQEDNTTTYGSESLISLTSNTSNYDSSQFSLEIDTLKLASDQELSYN
jgi:hypothetical protein